jgi:hypothetical protein
MYKNHMKKKLSIQHNNQFILLDNGYDPLSPGINKFLYLKLKLYVHGLNILALPLALSD